MSKFNKSNKYLIFGILGGLTFTIADWFVFYGDATPISKKFDMISKGTGEIASWRYNWSMILSFLSVVLLGIGLFSIEMYIPNKKHKTIFHYLNVVSLTSWSTLHMLLCITFYTYRYMMNEGYQDIAINVCEAIGSQYIWVVPVCYSFMYPFFLYFIWLVATGRTYLNRFMALTNGMVISFALFGLYMLVPRNPFFLALGYSGGNLGLLTQFIALYIYSCITSTSKKLNVDNNNSIKKEKECEE